MFHCPLCTATGGCSSLIAPSNGDLICTDQSNPDSVCVLSCSDGFSISNNFGQVRRCLESGRWSGSPTSCLREFFYHIFKVKFPTFVNCYSRFALNVAVNMHYHIIQPTSFMSRSARWSGNPAYCPLSLRGHLAGR